MLRCKDVKSWLKRVFQRLCLSRMKEHVTAALSPVLGYKYAR